MPQTPPTPDVSPEDTFQQRVESGLYDELADKLANFGATFLGNAIFNEHFVPSIIQWSKNQMYRAADGSEFRCNIVGELGSSDEGSAFGAAGSFRFEGAEGRFEAIQDSTKVKDRFVLKCPTNALPRLATMFYNQIAALNEAREHDEAIERADNKDPNVYEQWTKCSSADNNDDPADMLCLNMGPKYIVPPSTNNQRSSASSPPKKRLRRQDENSPPSASTSSSKGKARAASPSTSQPPAAAAPALQIGDLHEPSSQLDYGGPGFELDQAKLVQRDVRDINGRLVHPKDYSEVLRPGSLLLVNATLHCFIMAPNERNKRERKFYQMNAHSIRVIAVSSVPPQHPRPRTTTGSRRALNGGKAAAATQAYEEFTLVTASLPAPSSSPPATPSPSSSTETPSIVDHIEEDGELIEEGELAEEAPHPKGKKGGNRRQGGGRRKGADADGMECD